MKIQNKWEKMKGQARMGLTCIPSSHETQTHLGQEAKACIPSFYFIFLS